MSADGLAEHVARLLADAPPLTGARRERIRSLLTTRNASGRVPEQHHPQGRAPRGDSSPGRAPGGRADSTSAA